MPQIPLTHSTRAFVVDATMLAPAKAMPEAGAFVDSEILDLGSSTPRRPVGILARVTYDALPNLVEAKSITFKLQDCDTVDGTFYDVGVESSIVGDAGNGHGAGQILLPLPETCRRFIRVIVTVEGDAGVNTAGYFIFTIAFWN